MEAFAALLILVAAATWVGAIVFQSAIVAPAVFSALDVKGARLFLRALFPRFFRFGLVCGVLMIAGVLLLGLAGSWSGKLLAVGAATVMMLALQIVSLKLVPHINAARDAGESAAAKFHGLHRLSVVLTVIVLLLGALTLGVFGVSAASILVA